MDRAGAQVPAQDPTSVGSTCYPASALDMPIAPVALPPRAAFVPPVPRLSPKIAAICFKKKAAALARRQARLLSNAPVVNIEAPAPQEPQRGYYTVDIPGLIAITANSTRRSEFCTGKTTADQARAATQAAIINGTQATIEAFFPARRLSQETDPPFGGPVAPTEVTDPSSQTCTAQNANLSQSSAALGPDCLGAYALLGEATGHTSQSSAAQATDFSCCHL
jgi:hypothetical protein